MRWLIDLYAPRTRQAACDLSKPWCYVVGILAAPEESRVTARMGYARADRILEIIALAANKTMAREPQKLAQRKKRPRAKSLNSSHDGACCYPINSSTVRHLKSGYKSAVRGSYRKRVVQRYSASDIQNEMAGFKLPKHTKRKNYQHSK
jgi:hypothetical protein